MTETLFNKIRAKQVKLFNRYGIEQASETIVKIMERIQVSPFSYLAYALENEKH